MGDSALGDALAQGDRVHARPRLDLLEPDPALSDGLEKRAVHSAGPVAEDEPGLDPAATQVKVADERQGLSVDLGRRNGIVRLN